MWTTFKKTACSNVRHMLPFHAFVLAYTGVVLGITALQGPIVFTAYQRYVEQLAPFYFVALPMVLLLAEIILAVVRRRRLSRAELSAAAPVFLGRLTSVAATLGMLILFMGSFTTFKTLMPALMGGFTYDRIQADIDTFLHGGFDPGPVLLNLLLEYPRLLQGLQWNYSVLWTALAFLPVFFIALKQNARGIRLRYCLTFVAVWAMIGSVLACCFLSAGPAFYADVTGDAARFAGQMQILQERVGLEFQAYLWQNYLEGNVGLGTGISAFPSVHVGVAMMNALFLREINRLAGIFGFAYVAVIVASSVLFGWHYAIDGYVSIVVVWLLYTGIKRLFGARNAAADAFLTQPSSPAKA